MLSDRHECFGKLIIKRQEEEEGYSGEKRKRRGKRKVERGKKRRRCDGVRRCDGGGKIGARTERKRKGRRERGKMKAMEGK